MIGVEFSDSNLTMGKPGSMTAGECMSLRVKRTRRGAFPCIESVFELSEEELAIVIKSKRIRLGILGQGMPPVYLQAEPLPEDLEKFNAAMEAEEGMKLQAIRENMLAEGEKMKHIRETLDKSKDQKKDV